MRTHYFFWLFLVPLASFAASESLTRKPDENASQVSSNLSLAGRKRILENIEIVEQNIKDTVSNLAATQKNMKTVEAELKDLEALEVDHLELKRRYQGYLSQANKEIEKNDKAMRDLDKWENEARSAPKEKAAYVKSKLDAARQERADRIRWKEDATAKFAKVSELYKTLQKNLADVLARKSPLQEQLASWAAREKGYQKLLTDLGMKKVELEKLARK